MAQPTTTASFNSFEESVVSMICLFCEAQMVTDTEYYPGNRSWICASLLCFVG